MPLVVFVILHYMTVDTTIHCVNSILKNLTYQNYKVVVVDNGSPDRSGEKLRQIYAEEDKISVLSLETNLGFSAGNNRGYAYARECLAADYIFAINNDTEIVQEDMVERAIQCYKSTSCYVMGPDIINLEQEHQNPRRKCLLTKDKVLLELIKEIISNQYWRILKRIKCNDPKIYFILKEKLKRLYTKDISVSTKRKENVVLQGACIIFSPLYIKSNTFAFEELTFLYGEEDLLALRCKKNNWIMVYEPDMKILHAEQIATKFIYPDMIEKKIFTSSNTIKAMKVIFKKICE